VSEDDPTEGSEDPEPATGSEDAPEFEFPSADPDAEDPREGPMGDLAAEIDRRRESDGDADLGDLFEDTDVEEVDREALWRQVAGEEAAERVDAEVDGSADGPTVESPSIDGEESHGDRAERVVEKRSYCQGCEHFSAPPDVHCSHEGTEILEAVDMEHFRVADCPVVAEDEELENV
jgi:hypothetical protein